MPRYLVAIQHPENYDPSLEGEAMIRDIGALNEEMDAAGARFFAGDGHTAKMVQEAVYEESNPNTNSICTCLYSACYRPRYH